MTTGDALAAAGPVGANFDATRRHLAHPGFPRARTPDTAIAPIGMSACVSGRTRAELFDQAAFDTIADLCGTKRVVIADLPVCARCARIAARAPTTTPP